MLRRAGDVLEVNGADLRFADPRRRRCWACWRSRPSSAVAITGEREQDTWISLATTLLTPGEVILAEQFGAVGSARRIGLCSPGHLVRRPSCCVSSIPWPVLVAAILAGFAAWFAATVGVFASAPVVPNSTRALAATFISLLILLNFWPFALPGPLLAP